MDTNQTPPERNPGKADDFKSTTYSVGGTIDMSTIIVTITGAGKAIGKTQLAEYVSQALTNWSPKGIERPQVVVVDAEHCAPIDFKSTTYAVGGVVGSGESDFTVKVCRGYEGLHRILTEALDQAQKGKGSERHNLGGDIPFERQRMQTISELIGSVDGMTYQACKKITEGVALPTLDRQVRELLGAIVYLAGMVTFLRARAVPTTATEDFYNSPLGKPHADVPEINMMGCVSKDQAERKAQAFHTGGYVNTAMLDPDEVAAKIASGEIPAQDTTWRHHGGAVDMPAVLLDTPRLNVITKRNTGQDYVAAAEDQDWKRARYWRYANNPIARSTS